MLTLQQKTSCLSLAFGASLLALLSWLYSRLGQITSSAETGDQRHSMSPFSLVGVLVLADMPTAAIQTALAGTAAWLDCFVLCPGIHKQHTASELHRGEYPAVAAMTTGYVFRVENPATVYFLQKVSKTAHLTTVNVEPPKLPSSSLVPWLKSHGFYILNALMACLPIFAISDMYFVATILALGLSRLLNIIALRRRATHVWSGALEPGVQGDLLVLLSQDRWVRIKGLVDDLKAVTSGSWLQPATFIEDCLTSTGILTVYLAVALAANMTQRGQIVLVTLLIGNLLQLGLHNHSNRTSTMFGRKLVIDKVSVRYGRRLDMAYELIEETKRDDWAIKLGMISPDKARYNKIKEGDVIM